ncbi:MAG TPA: hypothetical protein ENI12_06310, partial [Nitrospirae bacterium]|nr:hypothetical protein [Nitrospirota bacterium]
MDGQSDGAQEHSGEYDTVDVYEILQALKKRYKLIAGIFLVSVALAVAAILLLPPVYMVSATLAPGWLQMDTNNQPVLVDSPENIKSTVNNGAYSSRIIKSLGLDPLEHSDMVVDASTTKAGNVVLLKYETEDTEVGARILGKLISLLDETYSSRISNRKDTVDNSILHIRNNMENILKSKQMLGNDKKTLINSKKKLANKKNMLDSELQMINEKLLIMEKQNKRLTAELENIRQNTTLLRKQRDELPGSANKADPVSMILYSNTIQQNLAYTENLGSKIEESMNNQKTLQENARN